MKIRDVFWDQEYNDESIHRNKSKRPIFKQNQEINNICNLIEILRPDQKQVEDNLTEEERTALKELTENDEIIIKKADKSGNFVLLDKSFYRDKLVLKDHLTTEAYEIVSNNEDKTVMTNLKKLVDKQEDSLTKKEQDFIINFDWKTSNFYILPKIHKNKEIINQISSSERDFIEMSPPEDLKGRPMIAGHSPSQRLS